MFRNRECLIVSFLKSVSEGVPPSVEIMEPSGIEFQREETEVPDWIKTKTPEQLAIEMLEFTKKEFSEDYLGLYNRLGFHTVYDFFWKSKGIKRHFMPSDIQSKIERVNILFQKEILKEADKRKRERLEKEKEELPSLVSQCIEWARANDLKKLTVADTEAFIVERNLDLLNETKRALYAMANVKLKSRK